MNQSKISGVSDSVGKYLAMTKSLEWHGKETNSTLEGDSGEEEEIMTAELCQICCK